MNVVEAEAALRSGEAVVMPTDTVYGIAAIPWNADAVSKLFDLKIRDRAKPIPLLGANRKDLGRVAYFDRRAELVARRWWPGALTLVLPRAAGFTADLGDVDDTVAVRVPASPVALELLARTGPLAVTSANRSGAPPATTVAEAKAFFGQGVAGYVDGGTMAGAPSTILSLVGNPVVIREGDVSPDEVLQLVRS